MLGRAIRKALASYPEDLRVVIFGTGGLAESTYTNPILADDAYRTRMPADVRTYELTGTGPTVDTASWDATAKRYTMGAGSGTLYITSGGGGHSSGTNTGGAGSSAATPGSGSPSSPSSSASTP